MGRVNVLYGLGKGYKIYDDAIRFIESRTGVKWADTKWDGRTDVPDLEVNKDLKQKLLNVLPEGKISFSPEVRFLHSIGKSSPEIVELKNGIMPDIVDAVVYPDYDDLQPLLKLARESGMKIVIFGGGSSVTGGLKFVRTGITVSLDSSRLKRFQIDDSHAIVGAGFNGSEIEGMLNSKGFTIGNFPESLEHSSVGGWVATKATGQESNEYGDIENMLLSVKIHRSDGVLEDRPTPRESCGLMAKDISLGSEGEYGLISDVVVKLHKCPQVRYFRAYFFRNFEEGVQALKSMKSIPSVTRLSDGLETEMALRNSRDNFSKSILLKYLSIRGVRNGAMLIVMNNEKRIDCKFQNAVSVGSIPAKMWYRDRFYRPYIANELWRRDVVPDTLETSATWDKITGIYKESIETFGEIKKELGFEGEIMAHVSHVYRTGACIYFTFLIKSSNEMRDLEKVRRGLVNTFIASGGSVTHHHGLGKFFAEFLEKEKRGMHNKLIDPVFNKEL